MLPKIFHLIKRYQSQIVLAVAVALIGTASYNLGKIAVYQSLKTPVTITNPQDFALPKVGETNQKSQAQVLTVPKKLDQSVVASKKVKSKLYHFVWCPGASKIASQNKITFPTEAAAIAAGYTLAGNCKK